jgi:hypothetical protein
MVQGAPLFTEVAESFMQFMDGGIFGNLCETYDINLKDHDRALCDAKAAAQLLNLINQKREWRDEAGSIAA